MTVLRDYRPLVIIVACFLTITIVVNVASGLIVKSGVDASKARLRAAQVSGCYRTNIRTVALNRNAKANYDENVLFAGAVATPQPNASRKERALTVRFHARLVDVVSTLTWTPVVQHCSVAPTTVELPVAFSEHQPPKVDLRLSPAITGLH